jgi:hypothetical protein
MFGAELSGALDVVPVKQRLTLRRRQMDQRSIWNIIAQLSVWLLAPAGLLLVAAAIVFAD